MVCGVSVKESGEYQNWNIADLFPLPVAVFEGQGVEASTVKASLDSIDPDVIYCSQGTTAAEWAAKKGVPRESTHNYLEECWIILTFSETEATVTLNERLIRNA